MVVPARETGMIENREAWLSLLMSPRIEGGFVNDPQDSGGATNLGITAATLGDWRKLGRPATEDEVKAVTVAEARGIALARYWNAMRGDQLPSGLDIYAADFAFNSGAGNAGEVLQTIVGVAVDSFVGDKTVAACRRANPAQLLESYHRSRMAFLRGQGSKWERFGDGWTSRCEQMLEVARSRLQQRPALAEIAGSTTIRWAGVAALFSAVDLQGILNGIAPLIGGLPEMLQSVEPVYNGIKQASATPGVAGHVQTAVVTIAALMAAVERFRAWRNGRTVK
jgi:lysozyme family protein